MYQLNDVGIPIKVRRPVISLLGGLEDWIFFCTLARLGIAAGAPRGPACLLQLEHRAELAREVACSEAGIDAGKQYGHRCILTFILTAHSWYIQ